MPCLSLLVIQPARAGEPPVPRVDPDAGVSPGELSRRLAAEGLELARNLDFAGALVRFDRAYAAEPRASLLVNMGTALRYLGRNAQAARRFEQYLASPGVRPDLRGELVRQIADIDRQAAWLLFEQGSWSVELRVDGERVARPFDPRGWRVDAGEHTIVALARGNAASVRNVRLEEGEKLVVKIEPPARAGAPSVIRVVQQGIRGTTAAGGVLVGIAGAGVAVGIVTGVMALQARDEANLHCTRTGYCDPDGLDATQAARGRGAAATVVLVASGALLAGGIVLLAWPHGRADAPARLSVGLGTAGIGATLGADL